MSQIAIAVRGTAHQKHWGVLFADGLRRHGIEPVFIDAGAKTPTRCVACWGLRVARGYLAAGHEVLLAERGFVGDRMQWTSLAWNGLNGRGDFRLPAAVDLARWHVHFRALMQPWRAQPDGYALVLGQVADDSAVSHVDYHRWLSATVATLRGQGLDVRFRPHPQTPGLTIDVPAIHGSLAEALAGASVAVALNSNSAVDAVLAGTPTITLDEGAMAWPVSGHRLLPVEMVRRDRAEWAARLAWCQWSEDEIASGTAWAHVGQGVACD